MPRLTVEQVPVPSLVPSLPPLLVTALGGFVLVLPRVPSEMTAGLPLGKAAEELGKQTLGSFLITLDLTGPWMTLRLKWFLKSWTPNLRSRVSVVGQGTAPSSGLAIYGCMPQGKGFFLPGPHCALGLEGLREADEFEVLGSLIC